MTSWPWQMGLEAPNSLMQSILPGWRLADTISITTANSRAPETEREIVRRVSYGRQLGQMMDVLDLLLEERDAASGGRSDRHEATVTAFRRLRARIGDIKREAQGERLSRLSARALAADLRRLKSTDPDEYGRVAGILRQALDVD